MQQILLNSHAAVSISRSVTGRCGRLRTSSCFRTSRIIFTSFDSSARRFSALPAFYDPSNEYTCQRCKRITSLVSSTICASASSSRQTASGGSAGLLYQDNDQAHRPWLWQAAVRVLRSELLRRSLATVALVVLLRFTGFIPPPGIDVALLPSRGTGSSVGPEMFAGMLELPVSIGSLGLGPYLSAGIIVSLAAKTAKSFNILTFEYWAENGQEGRAAMLRLIQTIGTSLALYGAWTVARGLRSSPAAAAGYSVGAVVATMTAASAIHSAVVGAIEEHGIGDGSNVIIGASIMAGLLFGVYCDLCLMAHSLQLPKVTCVQSMMAVIRMKYILPNIDKGQADQLAPVAVPVTDKCPLLVIGELAT